MNTRGQSAGNSEELAWLAGFVDGEGCININRRNMKKRPGSDVRTLMLQPSFQVGNTNVDTMEYIYKLLHDLGVGAWMRQTKVAKPKKWKPLLTIQVVGQKRVKKLLEVLSPFLRTKRPQAENVLKFIESREAKPQGAAYSDQELQCADESSRLNKRGPSQADTLGTGR